MPTCVRWFLAVGCLGLASLALTQPVTLEPVPDKLVVLTFDDSKASHYTVVRPLLKKYGFGATFFITEGFSFATNKEDYLTWEQIAGLNRDGFEIGNHTRDHMGVSKANLPRLKEQVDAINAKCAAFGIPRPVSFAYPGNAIDPGSLSILEELGFRFARRGGAPEFPYDEGRGVAYEPGRDHPLLLPSAGDARPFWTLENLKLATVQARNGRVAILQFHGAPDVEHAWVHTPPDRFAEYMQYLHEAGFKAIALRDLAKYVDWRQKPSDPWMVIDERSKSLRGRQGEMDSRKLRSQLQQVYVHKSTSTTLPVGSVAVRRGELSHSAAFPIAANSRDARGFASSVPAPAQGSDDARAGSRDPHRYLHEETTAATVGSLNHNSPSVMKPDR